MVKVYQIISKLSTEEFTFLQIYKKIILIDNLYNKVIDKRDKL